VCRVQLVGGIVERYPGSLPRDEALPYLTCLTHTVTDCRRADLMMHVQRCLRAFATHWGQIGAGITNHQATNLWNQVWMASLR